MDGGPRVIEEVQVFREPQLVKSLLVSPSKVRLDPGPDPDPEPDPDPDLDLDLDLDPDLDPDLDLTADQSGASMAHPWWSSPVYIGLC